ncbi:MAG TPA: response regulator [Polyangiaceae bacterium]
MTVEPGCILVVEDDEHLRELFIRWLEAAGYRTIAAGDGVRGIELAQRHAPCLVVMDLGLPIMDGWEATRVLKRDARTRAIPIIAVTGQTIKTRREDARTAGCDAFLEKPCDAEQLIAAVRRVAAVVSP